MGTPAAVLGDRIMGTCPVHQVPGPPVGNPVPTPLPFSAPITLGVEPTVLIAGKPAAVVGSQGYNMPPHVGLHVSDPFMVPTMQIGAVMVGSPTVLFGGKPAARTGSQASLCGGVPGGTVTGTAATVMIA
jgi:uncharacterized Zn-binding protein involved in type VI secretion